ncbi:MAG: ABC transporter ATP-binding protein [Rhodospirillales bacterium 69-11]|nr:ABC transporter ATP-binding protein [Rhodospirillales bacterium]OJW22117.1 MAG: ABC transporter ATP-binding protein [Rhodospirillales bacterium 69-11]
MLTFSHVSAGYGGVPVLHDISFEVSEGETVALFGHNGAGKTTLLRCAVGDVADIAGVVSYRQEAIAAGAVFRNTRRGIGFVPQGHNVFRDLTVRQNLTIAGLHQGEAQVEDIYRLFPILQERHGQLAGSLSGGQQQILALGMALMTRPSILLLDEPSTGLAPIIVRDVMNSLARINKETGTTVVIVEQNIPATLAIASRALVLKAGRLVFDGSARALERKESLWALF